MAKCDFKKVVLQFYWNRTSAGVFFRKFAAYFQTIFLKNTSEGLLLERARETEREREREREREGERGLAREKVRVSA